MINKALTIKEVASILKVTSAAIRLKIKSGVIPSDCILTLPAPKLTNSPGIPPKIRINANKLIHHYPEVYDMFDHHYNGGDVERFYKISNFSKIISISITTVRAKMLDGIIPYVNIPREEGAKRTYRIDAKKFVEQYPDYSQFFNFN